MSIFNKLFELNLNESKTQMNRQHYTPNSKQGGSLYTKYIINKTNYFKLLKF